MIRSLLPPWQLNYTSDDYVEYTWHTPTVQLSIGRATLKSPRPGYEYPAWAWNAMGGYHATINPTVYCTARCIGAITVELMINKKALEEAQIEFKERTGGGIGGSKWVAPLLPKDFKPPVGFCWPEYVTTPRGAEWWIPETA